MMNNISPDEYMTLSCHFLLSIISYCLSSLVVYHLLLSVGAMGAGHSKLSNRYEYLKVTPRTLCIPTLCTLHAISSLRTLCIVMIIIFLTTVLFQTCFWSIYEFIPNIVMGVSRMEDVQWGW